MKVTLVRIEKDIVDVPASMRVVNREQYAPLDLRARPLDSVCETLTEHYILRELVHRGPEGQRVTERYGVRVDENDLLTDIMRIHNDLVAEMKQKARDDGFIDGHGLGLRGAERRFAQLSWWQRLWYRAPR